MKKFIFKMFLICFFASLLFFGIDRVYASSTTWLWNNAYAFSNNSSYSGSVSTTDMYGNRLFKSLIVDSNNSVWTRILFTFNDVPSGVDTSKTYDVDFLIKADVNKYSYNNATVLFNNKQCNVETASFINNNNDYYGSSSYFAYSGSSQLHTVHCESVSFYTNYNETDIFFAGSQFPQATGENTRWYFGMSQNFVYSVNESVTSAIEEQNEKIDETNQKLQETNDTLNDDDTSEATGEAGDFFSGFSTDTHGLTGIITAPLTLIGNITSSTCSPLSVPLPFVGENLSLPCMSSIYSRYFGNFYDMYKIITFGIVAYWVCVRVFALVKDFKNPEHDEIEVMDL